MQIDWDYAVAVRLEEDGDFHAYLAERSDVIAWGSTREEALRQAHEGLAAAVAGLMRFGGELQVPPALGSWEGDVVSLPPELALKATLYVAWKGSGLTKVALADRIDRGEKETRRLLDPTHKTKLSEAVAALQALGFDLVIGARQAAPPPPLAG